jgi:hypothetical protein
LNRHIHLDLPGPRSTTGHWLQSSIVETINLPRKNTKEELKELQEFKKQSQEAEPREPARVGLEGSRSNTCLKTELQFALWVCFGRDG